MDFYFTLNWIEFKNNNITIIIIKQEFYLFFFFLFNKRNELELNSFKLDHLKKKNRNNNVYNNKKKQKNTPLNIRIKRIFFVVRISFQIVGPLYNTTHKKKHDETTKNSSLFFLIRILWRFPQKELTMIKI